MYTYSFNVREHGTNEFLFVCEDWKASPDEYKKDAEEAVRRVVAETGKTVYVEDTRKKHRLR